MSVVVLAVSAAFAASAYENSQTLDAKNNVVLQWTYDAASASVALRLEAAVPENKTGGWLGLGWSPSGRMVGGDFVLGYAGCSEGRAVSLPSGSPPPNGPAGTSISNGTFAIENGKMVLSFTRPVDASLPGHNKILTDVSQCVLYAAADSSHAPKTCSDELQFSNAHNLFQGSAQVAFVKTGLEKDRAFQFNATLNYGFGVQLQWSLDTDTQYATFKLTGNATPGAEPGWMGLGFVANNQHHMEGGDFAIGYDGCVRFSSLLAPKWYGPPVDPVGFQAGCGSASVATESNQMTLSFSRSFNATTGHQALNLASQGQWLVYAMADKAAVPTSCGAEFTMQNGHNLYQGYALVDLTTGKVIFPPPL
eukprot:Hpha_TRINITY_DN13767_c0_g1::TRINITY_DN13767_c0_g1_i1::g.142495::m.142495